MRDLLGCALERDGRQMASATVVADIEFELDSGLTSDEGPGGSTRRASRPSTAGLEAGCLAGRAAMAVDFFRRCPVEPCVRPLAVVPGAVECQLLLERGETVRDDA